MSAPHPVRLGVSLAIPITDREYARRFEAGSVRNEDFHHREHLRLAWAFLQEADSPDAACDRMRDAIRRFAAAAGHPGKYHETMTVFWVRLLALVRARCHTDAELADILAGHAFLLDKDTPLAYYSRARLMSDDARLAWLPPDLKPLDHDAALADSRDSSRHASGGAVPHGA